MQSIHNILCEKLNPRSGVIKISSSNDEDRVYFDISWKGDFHFIVTGWMHYGRLGYELVFRYDFLYSCW